MAQVLAWGDAIADELPELLDLGTPAFFSSGPDRVIVDANLEYASDARYQRTDQFPQTTQRGSVFGPNTTYCANVLH
jgi:hypothetical protein